MWPTNIPSEALSARDVAATYAVRWEVELLFKELKSQYRLDQIARPSPPAPAFNPISGDGTLFAVRVDGQVCRSDYRPPRCRNLA